MKLLKIYYDTDKVLHEKCKEVPFPLTDEKINLIKDMVTYLEESQKEENQNEYKVRAGVGIAAPQIGILERFFAVNFKDGDKEYKYGLVNPEIISTSSKKAYINGGEGCLSVKEDHPGNVLRYQRITIKGYDVLTSSNVTLKLANYPAIVFQHEYDHLDGILYYDRINTSIFENDENAVKVN